MVEIPSAAAPPPPLTNRTTTSEKYLSVFSKCSCIFVVLRVARSVLTTTTTTSCLTSIFLLASSTKQNTLLPHYETPPPPPPPRQSGTVVVRQLCALVYSMWTGWFPIVLWRIPDSGVFDGIRQPNVRGTSVGKSPLKKRKEKKIDTKVYHHQAGSWMDLQTALAAFWSASHPSQAPSAILHIFLFGSSQSNYI